MNRRHPYRYDSHRDDDSSGPGPERHVRFQGTRSPSLYTRGRQTSHENNSNEHINMNHHIERGFERDGGLFSSHVDIRRGFTLGQSEGELCQDTVSSTHKISLLYETIVSKWELYTQRDLSRVVFSRCLFTPSIHYIPARLSTSHITPS